MAHVGSLLRRAGVLGARFASSANRVGSLRSFRRDRLDLLARLRALLGPRRDVRVVPLPDLVRRHRLGRDERVGRKHRVLRHLLRHLKQLRVGLVVGLDRVGAERPAYWTARRKLGELARLAPGEQPLGHLRGEARLDQPASQLRIGTVAARICASNCRSRRRDFAAQQRLIAGAEEFTVLLEHRLGTDRGPGAVDRAPSAGCAAA